MSGEMDQPISPKPKRVLTRRDTPYAGRDASFDSSSEDMKGVCDFPISRGGTSSSRTARAGRGNGRARRRPRVSISNKAGPSSHENSAPGIEDFQHSQDSNKAGPSSHENSAPGLENCRHSQDRRLYRAPSIERSVSPPLRRRHQGGTSPLKTTYLAPSFSEFRRFLERQHTPQPDTPAGVDHTACSAPQRHHSPKLENIENANDETLQHSIPPIKINKSKEKDGIPADSLVVSAQIDELEYTRALNANVSNFVSVKLCGKTNYDMWRIQMSCLMRSHNMLGLIDLKKVPPGNKNTDLRNRYENLLNGWLIGSLNEEIIKDNRIYEKGAKGIWDALEKSYDPYTGSPTDLAKELVQINPGLAEKPLTLVVLTRNFPSQIGFTETLMYPSLRNVCHKLVKRISFLLHPFEYLHARAGGTLWELRRFRCNYYSCLFPELVIALLVPAAVLYQLLCLLILLLLFPFSMLYYTSWKVLAFLVVPIAKIEMKRKEHKEATKFLKLICKNNSWDANSSKDSPFDNFFRESLMEAVRLDVYEVLSQILETSDNVMDVKNKDGHNIIQLAVINRSQKVYNLISPMIKHKRSYRSAKDIFNNNLLHLAGRLAPSVVLSCTTGAALQLLRELQWREEVEKLIEPTQHTDENVDYETPKMVFSREHASLVKEGEKWMKTTAESCSITAALIITIVFAAAITVPGGSNQETGIPLFKRKIAFNIFAVADAISLFSASTSLLVFLSILTTRFAENDFLISLPRRLFIGLCLLFLSTTAMMLAFSSILFLVFCDERPWMMAPIGGLTCFPIAAIVTLQLPLVIDLYQATSIPIFVGIQENEKIAEEEENEEIAKEEKEENRKSQKTHGDDNPLKKRWSTTCCLPVHRGDCNVIRRFTWRSSS